MLNEKQEKFAQAYVLHRNATEAAKAAGYAAGSANNQGYRLMQLQEVVDRVHELEQELETDVNVIEEIESQYTFAKANGHTNSAIKALELLSRVRGTQDEKEDVTDPDKLKEDLIDCAKILGKDFFIEVGQKAGFLNSHNKVDNINNKEDKQ